MSLEETMKARLKAANDMRAANVIPLWHCLGNLAVTDSSSQAGVVAKAILTKNGLTGCAALMLFPGHLDEHRIGMITAPWCGHESTIDKVLETAQAQAVAYLQAKDEKVPYDVATKALATFENYDIKFMYPKPIASDSSSASAQLLSANAPEYLILPKGEAYMALTAKQKCMVLAVACYEAKGLVEVAEARFISIAALVKGSNVTTEWVASRVNNMKQNRGFANLKTPSSNTIGRYVNLYLPSKISGKQYCEYLRQSYIRFTKDDFEEGKWLIQQAPGMNCAPLKAIAEQVTKNALSYSLIQNLFSAEAELVMVIKAMYAVIRSPYINIHRPYVPIRQYPSVALLCCLLSYGTRYNTQSIERMTRHKVAIQQIYQCLQGQSSDTIAKGFLDSHHEANIAMVGGSMVGHKGLEGPNLRTGDAARAEGTVQIGLAAIIAKHENERDKAFKLLCREFVNATAQTDLKTDTINAFCYRGDPASFTENFKTNLPLPVWDDPWKDAEIADYALKFEET